MIPRRSIAEGPGGLAIPDSASFCTLKNRILRYVEGESDVRFLPKPATEVQEH